MSLGKTLLVFLHGSGGTGKDVESFLTSVPLKEFRYETFTDVALQSNIHIFTPTSEVRRFTAMNDERMNIWFDRTGLFFTRDGLDDKEDFVGVERSLERVFNDIKSIEHKYDNIFFGGHSMGGVIALHVLRKNVSSKFRGIFCIGSCLLNMSEVFVGQLGSASKLPVLMMHGKRDDLVPVDWAQKTGATLLLKNIDVQLRCYKDAYHGMEDEQLEDLMNWMVDILRTISEAKTQARTKEESVSDDKSVELGGDDVDVVRAVDRLMQKSTLTDNDAKSAGRQPAVHLSGAEAAVPYTLEYLNEVSSAAVHATPRVVVKYATPPEYIDVMCSRPVLACGAVFDIVADRPNGVKVTLCSSDPHKTANEIGKRLMFRASSGSASLNPCQMS